MLDDARPSQLAEFFFATLSLNREDLGDVMGEALALASSVRGLPMSTESASEKSNVETQPVSSSTLPVDSAGLPTLSTIPSGETSQIGAEA
jgi:hypothetical protein